MPASTKMPDSDTTNIARADSPIRAGPDKSCILSSRTSSDSKDTRKNASTLSEVKYSAKSKGTSVEVAIDYGRDASR